MKTHSSAFRPVLFASALALAASASASDFYWGGGDTDIAPGTPLPDDSTALSGVWTPGIANWATDPFGTVYGPLDFADATSYLHLGVITNKANATIGFSESLSFGRMSDYVFAYKSDYNRLFNVTNIGSAVLIPSGNPTILTAITTDTTRGIALNAPLSGSDRIVKFGTGRVTINPNKTLPDFTGTFDIQENTFETGNTRFPNVKTALVSGRIKNETDISGGANSFCFGTWTLGANNSASADLVADDLVVTLKGGIFAYISQEKTRETMGAVDVETWGSIGHSNSKAGGELTLASEEGGLRRGSLGLGIFQHEYKNGVPDTRLFIPTFSPKGVTLPWAVTSDSRFLTVDSATDELIAVDTTQADANLSSWVGLYGPTSHLRVGNNDETAVSGALSGDLAIGTLSFLNKKAATYNLGDGNTLNLLDGGICQRAIKYGATQIVTNGYLTTSADKLYLFSCDTNAGGDLQLYSTVTGRFDVVATGKGANKGFFGTESNTYEGTTTVAFGPFVCDKKGMSTIGIPGDLRIRFGGAVSCTGNSTNQINPTASIVIESCGMFGPRGQTFRGDLTVEGGSIGLANYTDTFYRPDAAGFHFNGGLLYHSSSAAGTLNLGTDVDYAATSTQPACFRRFNTGAFNFILSAGDRTFDVADSATLPADEPEMVLDIRVSSQSKTTNGLIKTGAGELVLADTNNYAGATSVRGGTLRLAHAAPAGIENCPAFLDNNRMFFEQPVARNLAVGQSLVGTRKYISNDAFLTAVFTNRVLRIVDDYEVLVYSSLQGVSYDVTSLPFDKQGSLGTGAATICEGATLAMDPGITVPNTVDILEGGALDASGATLTGDTTLADGATLVFRPDNGLLTLPCAVDLTALHAEVQDYEPSATPVAVATVPLGASGTAIVDADAPYRVYGRGTTLYVAKRFRPTIITIQ